LYESWSIKKGALPEKMGSLVRHRGGELKRGDSHLASSITIWELAMKPSNGRKENQTAHPSTERKARGPSSVLRHPTWREESYGGRSF